MRTRTLAASATLLLAGSLAPAGPAEAAVPSCQGHRATLVGHGVDLFGTMHRDVIVTNGADRVVARGGDDLICVTRGPARGLDQTWVEAGSGDDRVDGRHPGDTVFAALMGGRDVYVGGRYKDVVDTGDDLPDSVRTGGGSDLVVSSSDADRVHLGRGADTLAFDEEASPRGVYDGGAGVDELRVPHGSSEAVTVDAVAQRATRADGSVIMSWRGFTEFDLRELAGRSITFRGTDSAERLYLNRASHPRLDLRLGGGDDRINTAATAAGRIIGGAGHDRLHLIGHGVRQGEELTADLRNGTVAVTTDETTTRSLTTPGFEDLQVRSLQSASVTGTAAANRLEVSEVCTATLVGGSGNDGLLSWGGAPSPRCRPTPAPAVRLLARGGPGDDVLRGSIRNDELLGGAGNDSADGRKGEDRCIAETRQRCENP